jgi:hypothetical protein
MSTQNILSVFSQASQEEVAAGKNWYKEVRTFCKAQAKEFNVSIEVVMAVLSALSPRNYWHNNVKDTITVLSAVRDGKGPKDVKVSTFPAFKEKAFRIVQESKPNLVKYSNKTNAFFDNIKYASSESVTIDVHAYSVYKGAITIAKQIPDKEYQKAQEAYQKAAKALGIRPYELQAVVWITWKRMHKMRGYNRQQKAA